MGKRGKRWKLKPSYTEIKVFSLKYYDLMNA